MIPLIQTQNLGKRYKRLSLGRGQKTIREALTFWGNTFHERNEEYFWAIRNISMEIFQGDVVGMVGRNGAGKTTLLSLISEVTGPTEGELTIRGRVGTLLGANVGFHPELTGRENLSLVAAIMGMTRAELASKFSEIVDFAGVGEFLDTPVKHYSTGMMMKLGFSIAVHLLPEVLILDEILAVGDAGFQSKAIEKTKQISAQDRAILFVSHNLQTITAICNKVAVLHDGTLRFFGNVAEGLEIFTDILTIDGPRVLSNRTDRSGSGSVRVRNLTLNGEQGREPVFGGTASLSIEYEAQREINSRLLHLCVDIATLAGGKVTSLILSSLETYTKTLPKEGTILCEIPYLALAPGPYNLGIRLEVDNELADDVRNASRFVVQQSLFSKNQTVANSLVIPGVLFEQKWKVQNS